ncbi:MAG: hypothetical protein LBE14_08710 [Treponema sp.]|jgi:signal peptidase I|nr:hypothetical protein [Treponema sp.]
MISIKRSVPVLLGGCILCVFLSCAEPVPLYGRWADNRGDTISFFDDKTFVATIVYPQDKAKLTYEGSWSILLNSLTLNGASGDTQVQIVTEWDIRGNMLYLDWTDDERVIPLTLYKISN